MSNTIQFKRTSLLDKRPVASGLALGEPAVVLHESSFGVFLKDGAGVVRKIGPIHVGSGAPNASPAGSSGNAEGEAYVDLADNNSFKVFHNGSWLTIAGAGGSSFDPYIVDFGLDTGSLDYGLVTNASTTSEDWGTLSYLTN